MKLKEYLKNLNELITVHPEILEYEAVFSKTNNQDDNTTDFDCLPVIYAPQFGIYDATKKNFYPDNGDTLKGLDNNAVVIN